MAVQLKKVYSQFDSSYDKILLGLNTDPKFDIHNYGCLLCSLTTVLNYFGKNETPVTLNDNLKNVDGWANGGEYKWGSVTRIYGDVTEKRVDTPNLLTDEQMAEIKAALDAKLPVIVEIDYNPKTVDRDSHYLTLIDYNPNDENDFKTADPLGGEIKSLKGYLAWFKPSARHTIRQYVIMTGPVPVLDPVLTPTPPTPTIPEVKPPLGTIPVPIADNEKNVKMASQYKEVVKYLEIAKAPEDTMFEDCRRVIAGFKSRVTDCLNKLEDSSKIAATANVQAETLKGEISTLKNELTTNEKVHKAELDALKKSSPNTDDLKKEYTGIIEEQKGKLNEANKLISELKTKLATGQVEANGEPDIQIKANVSNGLLKRFIDFIVKVE